MSHPLRGRALSGALIPPIYPNESLEGYALSRLARLNHVSTNDCILQLFSGTPAESRSYFRCERFLKFADGYLGSQAALLQDHTIDPFLRWMLDDETLDKRCSATSLGVVAARGLQHLWSDYPRTCMACQADDVQEFGTTIWRRQDQINLCTVCPLHQLPLYGSCGTCSREQWILGRAPSPSDRCVCGRRVQVASRRLTKNSFPIAAAISNICHDAFRLRRVTGQFTLPVLVARRMSQEDPIGSRLQILHAVDVIGAQDLLESVGASAITSVALSRVRHQSESRDWQTAIVVGALFADDIGALQLKVGTQSGKLERATFSCSHAELASAKARLLESWGGVLPQARKKMWDRRRDLVTLIRKADSAWLDAAMPKTRTRSHVLARKARDIRCAALIESRAKLLHARDSMPLRVSALRLTKGSPHPKGPLASGALRRHTETKSAFRLRCIEWVLNNPDKFQTERERKIYIFNKIRGPRRYLRAGEILAGGAAPTAEELAR